MLSCWVVDIYVGVKAHIDELSFMLLCMIEGFRALSFTKFISIPSL
jgi:hypothetical protein